MHTLTYEYHKPTDDQIEANAMWANVAITRHPDGSPRS